MKRPQARVRVLEPSAPPSRAAVPWHRALIAAGLAVLLSSSVAMPASARASAGVMNDRVLAFEGVHVISMSPHSPQILRKQTVIVSDGVITQIGRSGTVIIPDGALRIAAKGRYLMPALMDLHTHLWESLVSPELRSQDTWNLFLANGVTTVFDMGAFSLVLRWRDDIAKGRIQGPRIYSSSTGIRNGTHPTPDAVEAEVRSAKAAGHDAIKAYNPLSRASYQRLLSVARELDIPVLGHSPQAGHSMQEIFDGGQKLIAHTQEIVWTHFDPAQQGLHPFDRLAEEVPKLARRMVAKNVWLQASLAIFETLGLATDDAKYEQLQHADWLRWVPQSLQDDWDRRLAGNVRSPTHAGTLWGSSPWWFERVEFQQQIVKGLFDGGVKMVIGTDAGGVEYALVGRTIHDEFRHLVAAGILTYDVLKMATVNGAEFPREIGLDAPDATVQVGAAPDLILVRGNPIRKIKNLQRLESVYVHGAWLPRKELRGRLAEMATRFAR